VFNGSGTDDLGNDAESWAAATNVRVIAIQPSAVESVNGYTSRVVSDVDVAVPAGTVVSVRDRLTLPVGFGPGAFEVVAVEDANYGFHQWNPGTILKLKRVTG
jgi:hypothetical protein